MMKIDIEDIERRADVAAALMDNPQCGEVQFVALPPKQMLALIRVARAAKVVAECFGSQPGAHPINYLRNSLSDIEDSANG